MEERAGCFTLFVFLVSRDCCVALLHNATSLSAVCNPHKNISIIPYICKFGYSEINPYSYILSLVAVDETNISGCLHFSLQNI